jgi:O-antigen/teichoic acid export membrane protein
VTGESPLEAAAELDAEEDVLEAGEAGGKVIRGGAARTIAYAGGILVGLASTPLMVRHLGVEDFGRFVTVGSLMFIVTGLTEGGLQAIGVREYSTRDATGRHQLVRDLLGLRAVLAAAAIAAALLFGVAAGYDSVLIAGILISSAGLVLSAWFSVYVVPLTARLRLAWLAILDFGRQALTSLAIVALVVAGAALTPFFVAAPLATGVSLVAIWLLVRGREPGRPSFDRREWWTLLRDSLPYAAALAVSVLYFRVGVILSSLISSETQTGYYSLAFRIVELVSGVPWLLVGSAFPVLSRAARDDSERLRYALGRTYEVSLILGAWVALAIGLGAPFAVEVVGGRDEFEPSIEVLSVLGPAMLGTFLIACWGHGLLTLHRHFALLAANVSAFVLGTGLAAVLISSHGALGAAIATTATELWLAAVYLVLLLRARADLRPRFGLVPAVVLAAGTAVAVPLLLDLPSVPATLLGSALFFLVLGALRQIPPELFDALRLQRSGRG